VSRPAPAAARQIRVPEPQQERRVRRWAPREAVGGGSVGRVDDNLSRTGDDSVDPDETTKHTLRALAAAHEELAHMEESLHAGHHPISGPAARLAHVHMPAWLRPTKGESRWPDATALFGGHIAIGSQWAPESCWEYRCELKGRWDWDRDGDWRDDDCHRRRRC
jgi:hypothetical protein